MTKNSGLKVYKITLVLFLCTNSVYSQYVCDNPNGTVAGSDYCYTFHTEPLDWIAAREFCATQNGQLPITTDSVTSSTLRDLLRQRGEADSWLGGTVDHRKNYDWFWISDGSPIDLQGCYDDVFLRPDLTKSYTITDFTDINCINECSNPPDSLGPYIYAGVQSQGACYCANDYGTHSDYALVGGCGQACLGDASRERCGGALKNAIYLINGSYADWSNNEPDGEICGVIDEEVQNKRLYADEHCNSQFAFICQIGDSGICPTDTGYSSTAGRCYYVSSTNTHNWFQAQEECVQKGGNLVKISDETERENIETLLQNLGATDPHWIGLTRMKWMWNTSTGAEEALSYTDWSSTLTPSIMSIPVNHNFCLISSAADDYKWFSEECFQNISVVCQHKTISDTMIDAPSTNGLTESPSETPVDVQPSEALNTDSETARSSANIQTSGALNTNSETATSSANIMTTPNTFSTASINSYNVTNSANASEKTSPSDATSVLQPGTVEITTYSMMESITSTSVEPTEASEIESVTNTIGPTASTVPSAETSATEGDMISPSQNQSAGTSASTLDQQTSGSLTSALSSSTPSPSSSITEEITSETDVTETRTEGNNQPDITASNNSPEESSENDNDETGTDNTTSGEGTPHGPQAGASTGDDDGLSNFQIVLIVAFCILGLLVLITAVLLVYFQKKKGQQVGPTPAGSAKNNPPPDGSHGNGDIVRNEEEGSTVGLVMKSNNDVFT